jgi:hypothetical protein
MTNGSRKYLAGLRKYYQDEIETMIRQMKTEGGTLDDCLAELRLLAEFVHSQADTLKDGWPNLLQAASYEGSEQRPADTGDPSSSADAIDVPKVRKGN